MGLGAPSNGAAEPLPVDPQQRTVTQRLRTIRLFINLSLAGVAAPRNRLPVLWAANNTAGSQAGGATGAPRQPTPWQWREQGPAPNRPRYAQQFDGLIWADVAQHRDAAPLQSNPSPFGLRRRTTVGSCRRRSGLLGYGGALRCNGAGYGGMEGRCGVTERVRRG